MSNDRMVAVPRRWQNPPQTPTFLSLVRRFTLRTRLIPVLPLILVARPADRKCTDIASNERLTIHTFPYVITTNLADLTAQSLHGLALCKKSLRAQHPEWRKPHTKCLFFANLKNSVVRVEISRLDQSWNILIGQSESSIFFFQNNAYPGPGFTIWLHGRRYHLVN